MTQAWSIYVELDRRDAPDDLYDDLHEQLAAAHPAVSTAPNGNLSVRIFVEASTARQAIDTGLKTVSTAAKDLGVTAPVVGVEALTETELDRRNDEPVIPNLVGVGEIAELLNVSRGRVGQLAARDDFPPAVAHLKSGPVYIKEQVQAFERRWDRKGGRPLKAVHLTGLERDLLAALRIARNSLAHGRPVNVEEVREAVEGGAEWRDSLLRALAAARPSGTEPEVLRIAFDPTGEVDEALSVLRSHRLIDLHVMDVEGKVTADVELTSRGERAPIA
ncbi:hypothetical protein ACFW6S_31630 [Streptomyces sp. NPDC058740]|uniref:hypothetical protein n=1 Tax=Streptomyces sp. NPDC058740 TaxID=3346619 RepID=UPI003678C55D